MRRRVILSFLITDASLDTIGYTARNRSLFRKCDLILSFIAVLLEHRGSAGTARNVVERLTGARIKSP